MNLFKPSDFKTFESQINRITASEDANSRLNEIFKLLLRDPTNEATGLLAQGYREALNDIRNSLENYD